MAWLIFVIAKRRLLRDTRNVADLAFLMCAVLFLVVQYAPSDVICDVYEGFKRDYPNLTPSAENQHEYLEKL
jgi:hypothetical protein